MRSDAKRKARKRAGDPFRSRPISFLSSEVHESDSDRSELSSDSEGGADSSDSDSDLGGFLVD